MAISHCLYHSRSFTVKWSVQITDSFRNKSLLLYFSQRHKLDAVMPNPPPTWKKKAVVFTTVTMSAFQDQLNTGFSKVCEIFKVCGIESLKYVREFYTPVCYCGDISTPLNMTRHKTKRDWLLYLSVIWPLGRALANESATIHSRPSAVSLTNSALASFRNVLLTGQSRQCSRHTCVQNVSQPSQY